MSSRWRRLHHDAIDGTGRNAQLTSSALGSHDGMHGARGAHDCVDRARLNALGAADARCFVDESDGRIFRHDAELFADGLRLDAHQLRQRVRRALASRRALIDAGASSRDCFGVRATAGERAAAALRLRQQRVDAFDKRAAACIRRVGRGGYAGECGEGNDDEEGSKHRVYEIVIPG